MRTVVRLYVPYLMAAAGILVLAAPQHRLSFFALWALGAFTWALVGFVSVRPALQRVRYDRRASRGNLYAFTIAWLPFPVIKIGREAQLFSRLRQHRTATPFGLWTLFSIPVRDAVSAEAYLHQRYAANRLEGNEWFLWTPVMFFEVLLLSIFGA